MNKFWDKFGDKFCDEYGYERTKKKTDVEDESKNMQGHMMCIINIDDSGSMGG